MVLDVCRIKVRDLGMRKLSARWVPRLLTLHQKRVGVNMSNALFAQFRRNKSELAPPNYSKSNYLDRTRIMKKIDT